MRTILVLAALAAAPGVCRAAVVYDNIRDPSLYFLYSGTYAVDTWERAQDVHLAGGAGATLETVTLLLHASILGPYNAPVWVGLYTDNAAQPGTLIASSTRQVQLTPQQVLAVPFDFTGVEVPASLWVSFLYQGEPYGGIAAGVFPTVGTTSGHTAVSPFGAGTWSVSNATGFGIRLTSIPAPGTGAFALVGAAIARRRRR